MTDKPATRDGIDAATSPSRTSTAVDENELRRELNTVSRDVITALPSASTRGELTETICALFADSELYRTVCVADRPTWAGCGDEWTVAGTCSDEVPPLPEHRGDGFDSENPAVTESVVTMISSDPDQATVWTVVPLTYDRTIYGVLCLLSARQSIDDYEREVLRELGEAIGYAINATETRRLLTDTAVIELELVNSDASNPLIDAARSADCRFELDALVPATEHGSVAYLTVENASPSVAGTQLAADRDDTVQTIRESNCGECGVIAWALGDESLLGLLVDHGANVTGATVQHDTARYTAELASGSDVRQFLASVQEPFPDTWLCAKRELTRPIDLYDTLSDGDLDGLTDRQREALEAAYHAGYYRWPRDSTAEEVADTLGITAPTLHAHLRKAENHLLERLIEAH
jgi:DNA-binding CsgD family transcriptional regulator